VVRHGVQQGSPLTRGRLVVLALVALAALPPISLSGPQDRTRYELTRHVVLFHTIRLENNLFDRALYKGHTYADKAPGMSFLAIVPFELERVVGIAKAPADWHAEGDASLWLVRILTAGVLFLVAVAVVMRLADAVVEGTGTVVGAVYGVATLAAPLAPTFFEHDAGAAFTISSFALLWLHRRRWAIAAAGLLAGTAVCFDYSSGLIVVALLGYCLYRHRRGILWFLLGVLPPAVALGVYDWFAFGSPFRLSYRYVNNEYTEQQRHGFFGIGSPSAHSLWQMLLGPRGLLVWSPVCVLAGIGLWLLWRRGLRAEAVVAALVTVAFVFVDAGYFLPYGGGSPGPRFFVPALPFLMLGLPSMLRRFPLPTVVVALVSVVTMAVQALSWGVRSELNHAYLPGKNDVMATIWMVAGLNRDLGAALVLAAALAAFGVSLAWMRRA
jgi:hypothetical protein